MEAGRLCGSRWKCGGGGTERGSGTGQGWRHGIARDHRPAVSWQSPHKFEKFALEKIGTGEGAQAYGHGLYFAENDRVAREYQRNLSGGPSGKLTIDGRTISEATPLWAALASHGGDVDAALHSTVSQAATLSPAQRSRAGIDDLVTQLEGTRGRDVQLRQGAGHLYEVKLDANPEDFLDWDAPLSEQPLAMDALRGMDLSALPEGNRTRRMLEMELAGQGQPHYPATGRELLNVASHYGEQRTAEHGALMPYGIKGVQYLDQGSRGAGNGTRNYVVYDPNIIDILNRH
jgi:hypothetical protein